MTKLTIANNNGHKFMQISCYSVASVSVDNLCSESDNLFCNILFFFGYLITIFDPLVWQHSKHKHTAQTKDLDNKLAWH